MSDVIEFEDIFGKDAFEKGVQGVAALTNGFKEMAVQLGKVAAEQKEFLQGLKINNSDDIKKLTAELQKAQKTIVDLNNANAASKQGEIELAKLRQANAKALQEEEKAQQQKLKTEKAANQNKEKTLTLYQQESKLLRDLKNEYKNVALAQGQTSKAAQDLLAKITPLDAKLKQLDKTTGDNFRNVGNYKSALEGAAGAVTNILGAAGVSLGLGSIVTGIIKTTGEFQKFEAVLTNTLGSKSEAQKSLSDIKDFASKTPFSVSELTESFVKLANTGFKPTNGELKKLGDLASSQGKSFNQLTEAVIDAQTGEFERLKEFGIRAKKEGDKVTFTFKGQKEQVDLTDAAIQKYILGLGDAAGVSGSMAAISETLEGKISNLGDQYDSFLNTVGTKTKPAMEAAISGLSVLLSGLEGFLGGIGDIFSGNLLSAGNIKDLQRIGNITEDGAKQIEAAGFRINNVYDAQEQSAAKRLFTLIDLGEGLAFTVEKTQDATEKQTAYKDALTISATQLKEIQSKYKTGQITQEEYSASLNILTSRQNLLNQAITKVNNSKAKGAIIDEKLLAQNRKEAADDEAKLRKQIEDRNANSFTEEKQRSEELAKLDFERRKKEIEQSKATKKTKDEALLTLELEYYNKLADIENKYIDEKEKREKAEKEKAKKEDEAAFDAAVKYAKELTDKEDKEREEKNKKEKEAKEKELKDLFDTTNKALEIAEKKIKAEEKLLQDALDNEIDLRQRNIDEQKRRAEQGLTNTLAFEEKALKDAEARKAEEEKKAVKREKTISFFKLLSANAEKDPANALQKTLTEILLAEAISGAFFKGTERVSDDLQGNKVHNGRDGYVVAVDGSERVLTGEQNKLIGNMSNEDLAKLAHDYKNNKLLPNYMLNEGVSSSVSENIYASMQLTQMVKMNERLESLEEAIKNKPVSNVNIDNLGNIIKQEIRNGLLITTKKPLTRGY